MWKRDDAEKPDSPVVSPGPGRPGPSAPAASPEGASSGPSGREVVNIGKSVVIKGELSGSEDLTIEGKVDGQIELRDHVLTIGPNGRIKATISAKSVAVMGHVIGNVSASDKINIRENGRVEGDINAPTVAIAEGARFRGSVAMDGQTKARASKPRTETSAEESSKSDVERSSKPAAAPVQPAARAAH